MSQNQFVSFDHEFVLGPPDRMRVGVVHHEAAHAILAYYYGYQIGGFAIRRIGDDWLGALQTRLIENAPIKDTIEHIQKEARRLLAGDIAGRTAVLAPINEIVLPLRKPRPETLSANVPFDDLEPIDDQRYDAIRVLQRYAYNQDQIEMTWWHWMWTTHAESRAIVESHWMYISALAEKFMTVNLDQPDHQTGGEIGYVTGDKVIAWCREIGAPIETASAVSISFSPPNYAHFRPQ